MKGLWHTYQHVKLGGGQVDQFLNGFADGFVVLARFTVRPGRMAEFLRHIGRNAAASVADEPGCRRFDVLTAEAGDADEVVLYEIYDSPAAFEAHLQTPHFAAFRAATEQIVLRSAIERLVLRENARVA